MADLAQAAEVAELADVAGAADVASVAGVASVADKKGLAGPLPRNGRTDSTGRHGGSKSGASERRPPRLSLTIQTAFSDPALPIDRPRLRRWVRSAIERDARLLIRFVDRSEGRRLNREFRQRDKPTNVLTFDYAHEPVIEADIVICVPVVLAEARKGRLPATDHLAHLVIHGVLHAQGHEHEEDTEAEAMESQEARLLRRFGIANPYRDDDTA